MSEETPLETTPVQPDPPREPEALPPVAPRGIGGVLAGLLQKPGEFVHSLHGSDSMRLVLTLAGVAIVCFLLFGLLVGNFSRGDQIWAAPLKITLGAVLTLVICFPSFYVFSCLAGASERLRLSGLVGMLFGMLAIEGLLLVSFAPVAWVFSESTHSVAFIGAIYLLVWAVAVCFGLRFLRVGAAYLATSDRGYLAIWGVIFVLVNLQMMTALRPLVGTSDEFLPSQKKFFLTHWRDTLKNDNDWMSSLRGPNSPNSVRDR